MSLSPGVLPSSPSSTSVDLLDLAAASLASSVSASMLIRDFCSGSDCSGSTDTGAADRRNISIKENGSYVTDADYAAQGIITQSIRRISEQVRIVGEESPEEMAEHIDKYQPLINYDQVFRLAREELYIRYCSSTSSSNQDKNNKEESIESSSPATTEEKCILPLSSTSFLPSIVPTDGNDNGTATPLLEPTSSKYLVDASRVSIFVDPIDGTKCYAEGKYEVVSILIAIIVDQKPCFGIICKPFGYKGLPNILNAGCAAVYGGTLLNGVYFAGSNDISCDKGLSVTDTVKNKNDEGKEESNHRYRAVISKSRLKGLVQNFCSHLSSLGLIHPKLLLVSGAGEKTFRLIIRQNNEGLWFFPKSGTYLWDVAAADAILRQLGGKLTDKFGNEMNYSKSRENSENLDGIIASIDMQLHSTCIQTLRDGDWDEN